jgi:hypothetical protein
MGGKKKARASTPVFERVEGPPSDFHRLDAAASAWPGPCSGPAPTPENAGKAGPSLPREPLFVHTDRRDESLQSGGKRGG